jgi:excisionase family DNA binding protein
MRERRDDRHQHPVAGGRRATDPPLTTRDCADWVGMGTDYIIDAIKAGDLKAERFAKPGKRAQYRIHLDDFTEFLKAIGFSRLPKPLT